MAITITEVALGFDGTDTIFAEDVPINTYLVFMCHFDLTNVGAGVRPPDSILDYSDNAYSISGNGYSGGPMTLNTGSPSPCVYSGLTRFAITSGAKIIGGFVYQTAKCYKLEGPPAISFESASTLGTGGTQSGAGGPFTSWSLSDISVVGEVAIIGIMASADNSTFSDPVLGTSDYGNSDVKQALVGTRYFSAIHFWDVGTFPLTPATTIHAEGTFGNAISTHFGGHLAFQPIYAGAGREHTVAYARQANAEERPRQGALLARGFVNNGSYDVNNDWEGVGSSTPIITMTAFGVAAGLRGRSTNLMWNQAGHLIHLGTYQDAFQSSENNMKGPGGYSVILQQGKSQGRDWDLKQTIWSPSFPPSDGLGYQAVEAALNPQSNLLVAMLFDSINRRWLSTVGHYKSDNTWEFSDPVEQITGCGPHGHLIYTGNGRFRFAYVKEGDLVRWSSPNYQFSDGGANTDVSGYSRYWRITDGDQVCFRDIKNVNKDGDLDLMDEEIVATSDAVSMVPGTSAPPIGPIDVELYNMFAGVNLLSNTRRGITVIAYHNIYLTNERYTLIKIEGSWRLVPAQIDTGGNWSYGTPVVMGDSGGDFDSPRRGAAFARRRDGRWVLSLDLLGVETRLACNNLSWEGTGFWEEY